MKTVYLDELSNEDFLKMLSKMLNILFMFSSQGSGWILGKVNRLEIKIAAFAIRACIVKYSSTWFPERMPFIAQHTKPF